MHIVGAGLSGLIAGAVLKHYDPIIFEKSSSLPNNHSAVLRFRGDEVSRALNIPFRKVKAIRCVHPYLNPAADALSYSNKVSNFYSSHRSISQIDPSPVTRYIAPEDLISRLGSMAPEIRYGADYDFSASKDFGGPTISTVPMHVLMRELGWEPRSEFKYLPGVNLKGLVHNADAYCSVYLPDPSVLPYRVSITGNEVVVEYLADAYNRGSGTDPDNFVGYCREFLGICDRDSIVYVEARDQSYAKILPIDENERMEFVMWASQEFNVYSLGRYATWRPDLLLDDLINDINQIVLMIDRDSRLRYQSSLVVKPS